MGRLCSHASHRGPRAPPLLIRSQVSSLAVSLATMSLHAKKDQIDPQSERVSLDPEQLEIGCSARDTKARKT